MIVQRESRDRKSDRETTREMHERGSEEKKQDTKVLLLLLLLMLMVNNARNNFDKKKIYILSTFKPTARQSDRHSHTLPSKV